MPELTAPTIDPSTVARVLLHGDLGQLTDQQKVSYYRAVCESVGINPLTQPFQYLVLNGREILYARREATEQLRLIHNVSIAIIARELVDGIYVVTARATLPSGRVDENIGAVPLDTLKGENRANAMMKAETKAKRRATLAICGLGLLDETEVAALPADVVDQAPQLLAAPDPRQAARDREIKRQLGVGPTDLMPATDVAIPPGYVLVKRVRQEPTKKPGVIRFHILLSSGHEVTTINQWQASVAEGHLNAKTPVQVETKETPWGTDLVGFK